MRILCHGSKIARTNLSNLYINFPRFCICLQIEGIALKIFVFFTISFFVFFFFVGSFYLREKVFVIHWDPVECDFEYGRFWGGSTSCDLASSSYICPLAQRQREHALLVQKDLAFQEWRVRESHREARECTGDFGIVRRSGGIPQWLGSRSIWLHAEQGRSCSLPRQIAYRLYDGN